MARGSPDCTSGAPSERSFLAPMVGRITCMDDDVTIADVLSCAGADLQDVARMICGLPADLQPAAALVELANVTTSDDALSLRIRSVLAAVAAVIE